LAKQKKTFFDSIMLSSCPHFFDWDRHNSLLQKRVEVEPELSRLQSFKTWQGGKEA
jgi:hypothetical protein